MLNNKNEFGQPIGHAINDWQPCQAPKPKILNGQYCKLQPLNINTHATELFDAYQNSDDSIWTYLAAGPFDNFNTFKKSLEGNQKREDSACFTVIDKASNQAVGILSYLRIAPKSGSIEVGNIIFSDTLQRTCSSTEAIFLLLCYAFNDLGYRRCEWKCDSLNEKSKNAATRFGFKFEGIFRQAIVYKQRNRDTAWYSIIDSEWPEIKKSFLRWLAPDNFDENGKQVNKLNPY